MRWPSGHRSLATPQVLPGAGAGLAWATVSPRKDSRAGFLHARWRDVRLPQGSSQCMPNTEQRVCPVCSSFEADLSRFATSCSWQFRRRALAQLSSTSQMLSPVRVPALQGLYAVASPCHVRSYRRDQCSNQEAARLLEWCRGALRALPEPVSGCAFSLPRVESLRAFFQRFASVARQQNCRVQNSK